MCQTLIGHVLNKNENFKKLLSEGMLK